MWYTENNTMRKTLGPAAWRWFSDKNSLTAKLLNLPTRTITFKLLQEGFESVDSDIYAQFPIAFQEMAWVRHIEWSYETTCFVHALTVIPPYSICKETQTLLTMHDRPIGEQLFCDDTLKRHKFTYMQQNDLWLRQSIFEYKQKPLLVRETFYPAFFDAINEQRL